MLGLDRNDVHHRQWAVMTISTAARATIRCSGDAAKITGWRTGADTLQGGDGKNALFGDDNGAYLKGMAGELNLLFGRSGADTLIGGEGDDISPAASGSEHR